MQWDVGGKRKKTPAARSSTKSGSLQQKVSQVDEMLANGMGPVSDVVGKIDPSFHHIQAEDIRDFLAQERDQLSTEGKNESLDDLYGVFPDPIDESPAMIATCVDDLDSELLQMTNRDAYEVAKRSNPAYCKELRLMFLRSTRFDPLKAARRLVEFFQCKQELFGQHKLCKKTVCLDDLDTDCLTLLGSGFLQLLRERDRAGRSVVVAIGKLRPANASVQSYMRAFWYIAMAALESEETQRKGFVFIVYGDAVRSCKEALEFGALVKSLPIHLAATHVCTDGPHRGPTPPAALLPLFFGSYNRVRVRCHSGADVECQYHLKTFGILLESLPISKLGEVDTANVFLWLERRRKHEESRSQLSSRSVERFGSAHSKWKPENTSQSFNQRSATVVMIPGPKDILLGRGKLIQEHQGNFKYRGMIESFRERYESTSKAEKTVIAKEIVVKLKNEGWRFLKENPGGGWIEVSLNVAREKVSHYFRNRRSKISSNSSVNSKSD